MKKKLYLGTDKKLCGVCSGIAEYLDMDATVVRLITLLAMCIAGGGLIAYFIAAVVMPEKPKSEVKKIDVLENKNSDTID